MALSPTTRATVNAASDTVTSGSFTPSADSLLVALVTFQNGGGAGASTCAMTGTGGLSWTSRANAATTFAFEVRAQIFTAPVGSSPSAQTVTATVTGGSADNVTLVLVEFTGYDTGTPTGVTLAANTNARSGAYTPSLSGTSATDSYVIATGIVDGTATTDATVGASWSSLYSVMVSGFAVTLAEHRSGALSTADWATFDSGFSTAAVAVEIKAAAGGAAGQPTSKRHGGVPFMALPGRGNVWAPLMRSIIGPSCPVPG
jgi:hypothetical protein